MKISVRSTMLKMLMVVGISSALGILFASTLATQTISPINYGTGQDGEGGCDDCYQMLGCRPCEPCTSGRTSISYLKCCKDLNTVVCQQILTRWRFCDGTWKIECYIDPVDTDTCNNTTGECH